ncbi:MAG: hypothetical protein IK149_01505 [Oscillospiraceae bacterium]|nr:hypothetical protein [Oscillospiraceae bacterium]
MNYNENTKLLDILKEHPGLDKKVAELDPRLSVVAGPLGKMMLRGKTVRDASEFSGMSVPVLLSELEKMIKTL